MPISPSAGSIGGSLIPNAKPIKNMKSSVITAATNGFVIQMQKVEEYGQDYAIAATVEDITKILSDYFN